MRCAFGECANSGVRPPFAATATPAVARTATVTKKNSKSFRRTRRAFYEGGGALACRPARSRSRRFRGVRRRRAPGSWRRLRGPRALARLPAADRAGGPPRLLALDGDVARRRRFLPQARDRRRRLRGRRTQARRDRPRAARVRLGGYAATRRPRAARRSWSTASTKTSSKSSA